MPTQKIVELSILLSPRPTTMATGVNKVTCTKPRKMALTRFDKTWQQTEGRHQQYCKKKAIVRLLNSACALTAYTCTQG